MNLEYSVKIKNRPDGTITTTISIGDIEAYKKIKSIAISKSWRSLGLPTMMGFTSNIQKEQHLLDIFTKLGYKPEKIPKIIYIPEVLHEKQRLHKQEKQPGKQAPSTNLSSEEKQNAPIILKPIPSEIENYDGFKIELEKTVITIIQTGERYRVIGCNFQNVTLKKIVNFSQEVVEDLKPTYATLENM